MKKDIDYASLPFGYLKTDYRFISHYKDGKWDEGVLSKDEMVCLNESAAILQYAQQVFEGLKAFKTKDGRVVIFRADQNAKRFYDSCVAMRIPPISIEKFLDGVVKTVKANIDFVPPYESGASLYLRPYVFGTNPILGVKPADEYEFRIFASPVGPYFKGASPLLRLCVSDYDRAAPNGTGCVKAALNYAMSMNPLCLAHERGFNENVYLDPATRTYIEETGGANIIFIDKDNKLVTPSSNSILPSITRKSLLKVAKDYLHMEVEERKISVEEIASFKECGLCGTAAVISPVGSIAYGNKEIVFETGPVINKLRESLIGMQKGTIEAFDGWLLEIK